MSLPVLLSPVAKRRLESILEYLEKNWSKKAKEDFLGKLDKKLSQVSRYPESCPESLVANGLRKCVVTKQTVFLYWVKRGAIEILTILDTRQDSKK